MEIKCEKCGQEAGQINNGRTKAGSQRYRCNHCGKRASERVSVKREKRTSMIR